MDILFKTRKFYPDELQVLNTLKRQRETLGYHKIKYYHFLIAVLFGAGFTYLAVLTNESFWVLPFGTMAVMAFGFAVFGPFEIYKQKKKNEQLLTGLNNWIANGTVDTFLINAKRIAVAKEYEDEGDLFIIEYEQDKLIYLWDYDYNLQEEFPCFRFEIYQHSFFKLIGKQLYPLSEHITPLVIDKEAKQHYMDKFGVPEHLHTVAINFDKLIEDYKRFV